MKHKIQRPAIAMIELIFAIVIIGIVMMSAPQLISVATKSGYLTMQQESINEASSQVNMIMGYHWDENNTDEKYLDPILNVVSGDASLDINTSTHRRIGTPMESYRSFIRSDGDFNLSASSSLGLDGSETEENDIDDFNGTNASLTLEGATAGTIDADIVIAIDVSYISDIADYNQSTFTYDFNITSTSTTSTNIKMIETTLTSSSGVDELNKTIILRAFSCNIGGYELEERSF